MCGFLTPLLNTPVNFVNARNLMKERGLRIEESSMDESVDYSTLIEILVEGDTRTRVAGTLFGRSEPRIVRVDDFVIDALPEGSVLFTKNSDQPGVIGNMGSVIGTQGVNIARMHLGRDAKKKEAIALINVDSPLNAETLRNCEKFQECCWFSKFKSEVRLWFKVSLLSVCSGETRARERSSITTLPRLI